MQTPASVANVNEFNARYCEQSSAAHTSRFAKSCSTTRIDCSHQQVYQTMLRTPAKQFARKSVCMWTCARCQTQSDWQTNSYSLQTSTTAIFSSVNNHRLPTPAGLPNQVAPIGWPAHTSRITKHVANTDKAVRTQKHLHVGMYTLPDKSNWQTNGFQKPFYIKELLQAQQ